MHVLWIRRNSSFIHRRSPFGLYCHKGCRAAVNWTEADGKPPKLLPKITVSLPKHFPLLLPDGRKRESVTCSRRIISFHMSCHSEWALNTYQDIQDDGGAHNEISNKKPEHSSVEHGHVERKEWKYKRCSFVVLCVHVWYQQGLAYPILCRKA